jgi:hypothetical protein
MRTFFRVLFLREFKRAHFHLSQENIQSSAIIGNRIRSKKIVMVIVLRNLMKTHQINNKNSNMKHKI